MTSRHQQEHAQEHAWELLDLVADDPQVKTWMLEAERQFQSRQEVAARTVARSKRLFRAAGLAAAALAALGLGVLEFARVTAPRYETHVGEQRDVVLADGSRMTLNTNTVVRVRYSREHRDLVLERGEALFSVAHDSARPFEVAAAGTVTRALGTEFNVDVRTGKVTVSVLDGLVQVSTSEGDRKTESRSRGAELPTLHTAAVAKGQALEIHPKEQILLPAKADLGRIDAWRTRRLGFNNTPLSEAVEEFNRYSSTQVVIGTRDLAARRVSGVFQTGDTAGFVYSLREALRLEAHESANEIVLMPGGH